jgi:hypothetical protein
MTGRRT